MHDDQIRGLLRTLDDDREPDESFADELFQRLLSTARLRRSRAPFLLLAAALLLAGLGVGVAIGGGLLRQSLLTVDASRIPVASASASATASPSASPTASPSPSASPTASTSPAMAFEAPPGTLPPGATIVLNEALQLYRDPCCESEVALSAEAGTRFWLLEGPLLVDGQRWYHLVYQDGNVDGWAAIDPAGNAVRLEEVDCPAGEPDLETLVSMGEWARLACLGGRELTIEGHEASGFGGAPIGKSEPGWLASQLGSALAITPDLSQGFIFTYAEPGSIDLTRPPVTGNVGKARLRLTGHFSDPASSTCSITDVPLMADPDGPTADLDPIGAELLCREHFVLTDFEVVSEE